MGISTTAASVWTLPSAKKTLTSVAERCFLTYLTKALGSVSDSYNGKVLLDWKIELLEVPTVRHKPYVQMVWARILLGSKKRRRHVEYN